MRISGGETYLNFREADYIEDLTKHNAEDIWEVVRASCIVGVDLVMDQYPAAQEEYDIQKQVFAGSPQLQWLMKRVIAGRAIGLTEEPVRAELTTIQLRNLRTLAESSVEFASERASNYSRLEKEARELGRTLGAPDYDELSEAESARMSDYFFSNYLEEIQLGNGVLMAIDKHFKDSPDKEV